MNNRCASRGTLPGEIESCKMHDNDEKSEIVQGSDGVSTDGLFVQITQLRTRNNGVDRLEMQANKSANRAVNRWRSSRGELVRVKSVKSFEAPLGAKWEWCTLRQGLTGL